jgi:hypothetical protein
LKGGSEIRQSINNKLYILGQETLDLSMGANEKNPVISVYYISIPDHGMIFAEK